MQTSLMSLVLLLLATNVWSTSSPLPAPLNMIPQNFFGIANLTWGVPALNPIFYILDTKYFRPIGNCSFDAHVAKGLGLPSLNVYQPCSPSTYQYKILSWNSTYNFRLTIMHAFVGSTYTENRINMVRNGTFDFHFSNDDPVAALIDVTFRAPPADTIKVSLAPKGWVADVLAPQP